MKQNTHRSGVSENQQTAGELQFSIEPLEDRIAPRTLPGGLDGKSLRILDGMIPLKQFNLS